LRGFAQTRFFIDALPLRTNVHAIINCFQLKGIL